MATRKRGKCCAGELCKHKNLQLCKSHKCSGCNGIVHLLCAAEDAKTDKRMCFKCSSKAAAKQPPPKSTKKKACKACGGTDHERKSSFLCKHNSSKKAPSSASVPSNKRGKRGEKQSDGKKNEAEDKNISRPNFVHMKCKDEPTYKPVVDVSSPHFTPNTTEFKLMQKNPSTNQNERVLATPEALLEHWWPMSVMLDFQASSNKYRKERMEKYPDLYCWKKKKVSAPFTLSCIYHFIAMLYYMGVVSLPSTTDYWSSHPCMPKHSVMTELSMSHDCFYFMWQHFHIYGKEEINVEKEEQGEGYD